MSRTVSQFDTITARGKTVHLHVVYDEARVPPYGCFVVYKRMKDGSEKKVGEQLSYMTNWDAEFLLANRGHFFPRESRSLAKKQRAKPYS